MNKIKLYRRDKEGNLLVKYAKVTQKTNFFRHSEKRTLPWVSEVEAWAIKNGWSRKKPTLTRLPSKTT